MQLSTDWRLCRGKFGSLLLCCAGFVVYVLSRREHVVTREWWEPSEN